jgi:LAO/AO transport system kinase
MKKEMETDLAQRVINGDRRAGARLITLLEEGNTDARETLKSIYPHTGQSMILGITGGTGTGKSTLIDHLIHNFRNAGKKVGVIVVDPSSPFSGGAFLGDRVRIQRHTCDEGVFIRSMASRGYLGGLARTTAETIRVMEAMGADVVLLETIGTGQDEVEVVKVAQTCILVIAPNMGDEIQALKAGLMEIGHIYAINKSDLEGSVQALREVEVVLSMRDYPDDVWKPKVVSTVALEGQGIEELAAAIREHQAHINEGQRKNNIHSQRVEYELGLVFKNELERLVLKGLKGTGKKKQYIREILDGQTDPYSVIDDVLKNFLNKEPFDSK